MTRSYITEARLHNLRSRLDARDLLVLATLRRVRLATGRQLERLCFPGVNPRRRRDVLARLVADRLLARLDRRVGGVRAGSSGFVHALDTAGQRLTEANVHARPRRPWTPGRLFVAHTVAVTELYVRLVEADRRGAVELLDFTTEPDCWRTFFARSRRQILKPDAYVRTALPGADYEQCFFVEVDCGTESTTAVSRKLDVYRAYWASGREQSQAGVFPWVLLAVPDARRHAALLEVVARQSAEGRELFRVALYDDAVDAMAGGQP